MWNKNIQRRGYKLKVQALYFLRPKLCLKSLSLATEGTDFFFSGDAFEHVDCAIHNLERQSVVNGEDDDDDDDGSDDVEGTKNFGDNDED